MNNKTALVCGAGGFIGGHLVKKLKNEGFWVRGVDLKYNEFSKSPADDFVIGDLRDQKVCKEVLDRPFDEVYQLAADMGGAGYIFTGEHDADVMHNSATINLNMVHYGHKAGIKRSSTHQVPVYILSITSWIQTIQNVPKSQHTRQLLIANMVGKII